MILNEFFNLPQVFEKAKQQGMAEEAGTKGFRVTWSEAGSDKHTSGLLLKPHAIEHAKMLQKKPGTSNVKIVPYNPRKTMGLDASLEQHADDKMKELGHKFKPIAEMDGDGAGRDGSNRKRIGSYGNRDRDISGPDVHLGPEHAMKRKDINKRAGDVLNKEYDKAHKKGVAEAGNKPLEKSRFGTGDTRTPRDIKSQMSGASDEFVKSIADKTTGPFHSKVAKMQGKMAKSELRKREQGVAEGAEGQRYSVVKNGKVTKSFDSVAKAKDYVAKFGGTIKDNNEQQGVAEGMQSGEYSRVLNTLKLYYPRLSMEELNTPGYHKVIANKAGVPVEYAANIINDFANPEDYWSDDEQGVAEGSLQSQIGDIELTDFYLTDETGKILAGPFDGRNDAMPAYRKLASQGVDVDLIQGRALIMKLHGLREQGVAEAKDDYVPPKEANYDDKYQAMVRRVGEKAKQQEKARQQPKTPVRESRRELLKQIIQS